MTSMKNELDSAAQELLCDTSDCTATAAQEVEIYEQDFRFCQHHFNELEPLLVQYIKSEVETVGSLEEVS